MGDELRQGQKLSKREKERIARELIQGYQKMASLNKKLAENGFLMEHESGDETK
ncbi:MAG: hypothetical protein ACQEQF_05780 [Bacillota bacterium]